MKISIVMEALTGKFVTDVKRAKQQFERDMKDMRQAAEEFGATAGLALTAAAVAFAAAMKQVIDRADELGEMSEKLGLAIDDFTSLGFVAKFSGIEIEKFGGAIRAFNARIEKTEPILQRLGVVTRDATTGAFRPATDIIRDLGNVFASLPEGIEQSQLAAELFGTKIGAEMIPLLNRGTEGIRDMEEQGRRLGAVLSKEAVQAAGEFNDEVDKLKIAINSAFLQAVPESTEAMKAFVKTVTDPAFVNGLSFVINQIIGLANGFAILTARVGEAFASMRKFASGQSDAQLNTRLAALQTQQMALRAANNNAPVSEWRNTSQRMQFERNQSEITSINREQTRRIQADQQGSTSAPAIVTNPQEAINAATQAMREQQQQAERAATQRSAASDAARKQAEAERELARAIEQESRAMEEARIKEVELRLDLAEAIRAEDEARINAMKQGQQLVSDMEFELELMRMTNAERATAIQLRGLEAEAVTEYGQKILELNHKIEEQAKLTSLMDDVRFATKGLFEDLISGSKSAGDAFKDFADSIIASIQNMIVDNFVQSLFGGFGQTGGGMFGGGIGGFFSGLFGFGGGRANGGSVLPGRMYRVNEEGPEMLSVGGRDYLMMGGNAGMVTPAHRTGRSVTQNINFMLPGRVDTRTQAQIAADAGRAANRAIARN